MEKTIFGMLTFVTVRIVFSWIKSRYSKYKMLKQLKAEVNYLQNTIKTNLVRLDESKESKSFPLLYKLDMPVHERLLPEYILSEDISEGAISLMRSCKHYNRIVDVAEKSSQTIKRLDEVANQGSLIFNEPVRIYIKGCDVEAPYESHSVRYLKSLNSKIRKCKNIKYYIPFYYELNNKA